MRQKYGIAVAGSHGKTTTTSMVAAVLSHAGLDPTIVVGGRVGTMGGANARLGKTRLSGGRIGRKRRVVSEARADHRGRHQHRSRASGSLLRTSTRSGGRSRNSSARFRSTALAILCLDDENVQQILPAVNRRIITYGWSAQADLRVTQFVHRSHGQRISSGLSRSRSRLFPAARPRRAQRAERDGGRCGRPGTGQFRSKRFAKRWRAFSGVDRRFQVRGTERGRDGDRRLRPSSHGDSRDARRGARVPV